MASSGLKDKLNCSICPRLYTDPISLRCGHNCCCSCIVSALDEPDGAAGHSCLEYGEEYLQRHPMEKKRKLGNIVERFLSSPPNMETKIFCTYCTKSSVLAVKSCLQCENSLCDDHLAAHNKAADHILTDPTSSFGNKKCSVHNKVLEYYCPQDAACLCVTCCLVGKHRGHQVELLGEASEKKKENLRKYLGELNPQKEELQTKVQYLQDHKKNIQEKASEKRKSIRKLFMDTKGQLEMAEKKVQSEISRQEDEIVSQISHLIKELEKEEKELSGKMHHMEQMCHVTDPIRLLQERDITVSSNGDDKKIHSVDNHDTGLFPGQAVQRFDTKVSTKDNWTDPITVSREFVEGAAYSDKTMTAEKEAPVRDLLEIAEDLEEMADDLDEVLISLTLHRSMRDIVTNVMNITSELGFHVPDMVLDVETASEYVELSDNLKTATDLEKRQERPESPGRFLSYPQVLSQCGLSFGRHYWEVAWNQVGRCDIGMSYPSIEREGDGSGTGDNDKSWCVTLEGTGYSVSHNSVIERLDAKPKCPMLRVFLDYEAGRLSFYELCDPIRHLHTFTAAFTEALHVIFYVEDGASVTILAP
ncbi:E3 ubiquitin/ISG15 ligase TRIM25-like isoform X1 [Eleutherodactylus coqui]|uniref:E3 ubiquitin/ISG15 ligase TRIM25-like isoform X1 n=1 Tax=Eleutherodactylus coqui TaxID=57060 RepID=UPI0034634A95